VLDGLARDQAQGSVALPMEGRGMGAGCGQGEEGALEVEKEWFSSKQCHGEASSSPTTVAMPTRQAEMAGPIWSGIPINEVN